MNVVHVTAGIVPIHGEEGGGVEKHVRSVAGELVGRGHEVTIVDRAYGDDDPGEIDGVPVQRLGAPQVSTGLLGGWTDHVVNEGLFAARLGGAKRRLAAADVVHAHNLYAGWRARRLARSVDVPFVYTCHNGMWCAEGVNRYERHVVRRLEGRLLASADAAIAVSEAVASGLETHAGVEARVVPNGVDVDTYRPDVGTADVVEQFGLEGCQRVLFVGRLVRAKGVDVLLRAAPAVVEAADGPVAFVLVGPDRHMFGGSRAEGYARLVQSLAEEVPSPGRVVLTGTVDDAALRRLYAAADVAVLPSRFEAQGMVLLEAMASGTPVVGTRVGGIPEVITADVGELVPPEDPAALARALSTVLDGESGAGEAARARAESVYAWPRIVDRLEDCYREVA